MGLREGGLNLGGGAKKILQAGGTAGGKQELLGKLQLTMKLSEMGQNRQWLQVVYGVDMKQGSWSQEESKWGKIKLKTRETVTSCQEGSGQVKGTYRH